MTYLDELSVELGRVGIRGNLRTRVLAEAADHLAEGDAACFGEPRLIAQRFADELATAQARRAAFRGFAVLAVAGAGFAAAWLLTTPAGGWPDIASGEVVALGVLSAFGMLVCPQVAFVAGLLTLLRAVRLRRKATAPAAEVALLLARTRVALWFGVASMLSLALYAVEFRETFASWYTLATVTGAALMTAPLVVAVVTATRATRLRSAVPGEAGGVFDDLPVALPRRPGLCLCVAAFVGVLALLAGGGDEGLRNAVLESGLVIGCFAALGRRLGLRR